LGVDFIKSQEKMKKENKIKNWWQGLKYWLKGGIIGLFVLIILDFLSLPFYNEDALKYIGWQAYIIGFPLVLLYLCVPFFIIGALIGLIIGKIKKK